MSKQQEEKLCIGFGEFEGICRNKAGGGTHNSPYWCDRCNKLRFAHIDKRFEELKGKKPEGEQGKCGRRNMDNRKLVDKFFQENRDRLIQLMPSRDFIADLVLNVLLEYLEKNNYTIVKPSEKAEGGETIQEIIGRNLKYVKAPNETLVVKDMKKFISELRQSIEKETIEKVEKIIDNTSKIRFLSNDRLPEQIKWCETRDDLRREIKQKLKEVVK